MLVLQDMDKWVRAQMSETDQSSTEQVEQIKAIVCPRCKHPVRQSRRYLPLINQRAIDIEKVRLGFA
jgi:hypothetical protein